jgi:hypothetical protein
LTKLFPPFGRFKADAFASSVRLDEINPGEFECSSYGRFVRQRNWNLPFNDLGSTDRSHAYL